MPVGTTPDQAATAINQESGQHRGRDLAALRSAPQGWGRVGPAQKTAPLSKNQAAIGRLLTVRAGIGLASLAPPHDGPRPAHRLGSCPLVTHAGWAPRMASLWSLVNTRALSVEVAQGAFSFEISWLGILLIIGALLLWRHLRR